MGGRKALEWVEGYLYSARGHRALENSVFAAGERAGFSERKLRRAGRSLGVTVAAGCWELPAIRAAALDASNILSLAAEPVLTPSLPTVGVIAEPVRARRAA